MWRGLVRGLSLGGRGQVSIYSFSLYCWENSLFSNTSSNIMEACNSGTLTATTREPRSRLDEALDTFDAAVTELDRNHRKRRT